MFEWLFEKIVDEDYGTYYMPTTAGYTAIAIALILIVLAASFFTRKKSARFKAKNLAFCSLTLALATVASEMFKLFHMPMGGSVTLFSMLFVTLIGYWYGLRTGVMTAIAYGCLQLVINPWIISLPQVLFDYVLSFGALGLSGLFSNRKHGLILGYLTGVFGRLFFAFFSGVIFFASNAESWNMSAPLYSLCYNGAYIGVEAAGTLVVLLIPAVSGALATVKRMALSEEQILKK